MKIENRAEWLLANAQNIWKNIEYFKSIKS